jgi:PAS domain S-box-containing protein
MKHKRLQLGLLLALLALLPVSLAAALPPGLKMMKFYYLTVDRGLSQNTIQCIFQDKQGFMWIGTMDGLNRFDGHEFIIYQYDGDDPGSISSSDIQAIIQDRDGKLWVGTSNGFNRFDPLTGRFCRYQHIPGDVNSLVDNSTRAILQDRDGFLWIGTRQGLNRLNPATGKFELFQHRQGDPHSLGDNEITALGEDSAGVLWIGTFTGGLSRYDRSSNQFKTYRHDPENPDSLRHDTIYTLVIDKQGLLWISTGSGLDRFDPGTEQFTHFKIADTDSQGLKSNRITFVFEDSRGDLWAGTEWDGLFLLDRQTGKFNPLANRTSGGSNLNSKRTTCVYEDNSRNLWIGTWDGGINVWEYSWQPFLHYCHAPDNPASLSSNSVYQIHEDSRGQIWIGTGRGIDRFDPRQNRISRFPEEEGYPAWLASEVFFALYVDANDNLWGGTPRRGLIRIDPQRHQVSQYRHNPGQNSIRPGPIWTITGDRSGIIWIGLASENGGVNRLDPGTGLFEVFVYKPGNPQSLSNNIVTSILEDHGNNIWIGTERGLNRLNPSSQPVVFTRFLASKDDSSCVSDDFIYSLYEDKEHIIWVGTNSGGLNRFDPATGKFTHYNKRKNGFPNDTIYGILGDGEGNLWLTTNNGMCKFNPRNLVVRNYDVTDGLQSNEFNFSAYKSSKGMMFFGGVNGFNTFYPEQIKNNPVIPPVVITHFKIFNEPVPIGPLTKGLVILEQDISSTHEIHLNYRQTSLSFEFSALNYNQPEKNRYRYIMEYFETKWSPVGKQRTASYTNLPPGKYVFRVTGSNNDGIWNETGAAVTIIISPPFWQTWWFRVIIALIIAGIIVAVDQIKTRLILKRKTQLERLVSLRTAELTQSIRALRESELKYRTVVERANDGIVISKEGIILYCNLQFSKWIGEPEKKILNRSFLDFITREERASVQEQMKNCLQKDYNPLGLESFLLRPGDEKLDVRISFGRMIYHRQPALLLFIQDIKAQKLLEEERLKTEKLESVGLLAGGISHDFNNLLAVIMGNIQLAMIEVSQAHRAYPILQEAENSSMLAADLTRQFITFSQGGYPVLQAESLVDIIKESTRAIPQEPDGKRGIRCECHLPADLWLVTCDRSQVVWVMVNLIKNALNAMPGGGVLEIKAENVGNITEDAVKGILLSGTGDKYVKITIRDEGVGIPKEHMGKIFDPYFSTRTEVTQKGLGLGLAIVHSIVKKHNGAIYAKSEVGVGTTFTIYLPTSVS